MTVTPQGWIKTALVILLGVATVWFFNAYPRYRAKGGELLINADFGDGLAGWSHAEDGIEWRDGEVTLRSSDSARSLQISQAVASLAPGTLLLLACDFKTQDLIGGTQPWEAGRIALFSFNSAGKAIYHRAHTLARQTGSRDWSHVERTFEVGEQVAKLEVTAQLLRSRGEMSVRGFSLRPVVLKAEFKQFRQWLLIAWAPLAIWIAVPFARAAVADRVHGLVLVLAVGILVGVLMPEAAKESLGAAIWPTKGGAKAAFVASDIDDNHRFGLAPKLPNPDIFKLGHLVMFALLACTLAVGRPYRVSMTAQLGYLCLLAVVSEILQLFMPGRTPQLGDIAIDCAGIATGLGCAAVWRHCRRSAG